jgi:hypothetical protein
MVRTFIKYSDLTAVLSLIQVIRTPGKTIHVVKSSIVIRLEIILVCRLKMALSLIDLDYEDSF